VINLSALKDLQPHLDILKKVVSFEQKSEFNKFYLLLSVSGFVAIVGGWISFVFHRFMDIDPTFFIFGLTGNPDLAPTEEPILFISVWLLYAVPILSVAVFSTGASGIINWNRAYRSIGALAISLFFIAHIFIILIGSENSQLIPSIWGLVMFIGFTIAGRMFYQKIGNRRVFSGLLSLGIGTLVLGVLCSSFLPLEYAQLVFGAMLGTFLFLSGIISYFTYGRLS
jgi:hypothetical protein